MSINAEKKSHEYQEISIVTIKETGTTVEKAFPFFEVKEKTPRYGIKNQEEEEEIHQKEWRNNHEFQNNKRSMKRES